MSKKNVLYVSTSVHVERIIVIVRLGSVVPVGGAVVDLNTGYYEPGDASHLASTFTLALRSCYNDHYSTSTNHTGIQIQFERKSSVKMSRRSFTLQEKRQICAQISNGEKNSVLCVKYNVSSSTISTIWKYRNKWLSTDHAYASKIKKLRESRYADLDYALLQWFKNERASDTSISGPILQEKANELAKSFGLQGFSCTSSWIQRFRERHGISSSKPETESGTGIDACEDWLQNIWPTTRHGFADEDVFYATQTGMLYKLTPNELAREDELNLTSDDLVSVLVCVNMSGTEKRPLLVVGKSKKPPWFENLKNFPVCYESDAQAKVTSPIFENVLYVWDDELRQENRKIMLLVDNSLSFSCPVIPSCIHVVVSSPGITSSSSAWKSPTDRCILKHLKGHYRKMLILKIIENVERNVETNITIFDALIMLNKSWQNISSTIIDQCFIDSGLKKHPSKLLNSSTSAMQPKDDIRVFHDLQVLLPRVTSSNGVISVDEFINADVKLMTKIELGNFISCGTCEPDSDAPVAIKKELDEDSDTERYDSPVIIKEEDDEFSDEKGMVNDTFGTPPSVAEASVALTVLQSYCFTNLDSSSFNYMECCLKSLESHLEIKFQDNS
ncbi:tigger transposable element-derived protein 4-like [Planococcus citri]|uniref:tigger transposable element-derived protein 4-like n=1 Tax=Planococcus citri TaxID=170843 RepID=UPI0031F96115